MPQDAPRRIVSRTGDIRVHAEFKSEILGNRRNVQVWLPPDYDANLRLRYPVVYLHDGQNVFDGSTSYIPNEEWRADETAQGLIQAKLLRPLILVAIDNAQGDRGNEYLPTRVGNTGGRALDYARFLREEVMPFVNRTYRTRTDANSTGLVGSSFGGIVTLTLGLEHPGTFGRLGVMSPSVWWDNREILRRVAAKPFTKTQRIWVDMGTAESPAAVADARALVKALEARGWESGRNLAYVEDGFAAHNERAWASRFGEMLIFLFGR